MVAIVIYWDLVLMLSNATATKRYKALDQMTRELQIVGNKIVSDKLVKGDREVPGAGRWNEVIGVM